LSYKREENPYQKVYEPNPKHHINSPQGVGKPPTYPHSTLEKAIEVPDKKSLVAIENKKFVVFQEHAPNKYHGYVVETFGELTDAQQRALVDAGLVRSMKSGKIVK